jgi:hypothetical protein
MISSFGQNRFESRNDPQRVLAVDRLEVVTAKDRGDPLGVVGRGPIREIRAIDDLRDRNEFGERGERSHQRDLRRVVVEAIELGLDLLAGELALVRRSRHHLHQQSFRNGRQRPAAVRPDPVDVLVFLRFR